MQKDKKSSGYWTLKTNCRKAAKRCKSKSELCKRFPSAYFSSVKNGWIDEFFPILQKEENYSGQKKTARRRPRNTRPVLNSVSNVTEHTECLWTMVG